MQNKTSTRRSSKVSGANGKAITSATTAANISRNFVEKFGKYFSLALKTERIFTHCICSFSHAIFQYKVDWSPRSDNESHVFINYVKMGRLFAIYQ